MLNTLPTIAVATHFLLVFLCAPVKVYAQNDHLLPIRDFSSFDGVLKDYYDHVFPLLHKRLSTIPMARYTAMPSFSREYAFSVEKISDDYILVSNSLSENYWYAKKRKRVKVFRRQVPIDESFYLLICDLFKVVIQQARVPEMDIFGLDGVAYYFETTDSANQLVAGETWSPPDDSKMLRLVNICDALYEMTIGKDVSQTMIKNDIRQLIEDLK
jgi:hypothetical protein